MSYQILVGNHISSFLISHQLIYEQAMNIIAWKSFWIMKPFKYSIMDAIQEFKSHGYVERLKAQITSTSVPLEDQDILEFLYNQSISI